MAQEILWEWGPWLYNKLNLILVKVKKIVQVVYNELTVKKEWVFLKNVQVAVPVNSEIFGNIEDSHVKWRCEVFPPRFVEPGFTETNGPKHLSYLGFVIKIDDTEIDLSDWINDVYYSGSEEPTVGEIFALWCCEQGKSYFHCLDRIQVEYITELGDVVRKRA